MNSVELRRVQLVQLEIAKEIKRICDTNRITYSLAYGTLLGAVRHRGFIPWDDDMDIVMPREEYNRFIEDCKTQLSEGFFLQTYDTDPYYTWPFAKVMKKGTIYREEWAIPDACNSVFVDVFPLDYCPVSKKNAQGNKIKYKLYSRMLQTKMGFTGFLNRGFKQKILKAFLKAAAKFVSANYLKNRLTELLTYTFKHPTNYYYNLNTPYSVEKETVPVSWYREFSNIEFEGEQFMASAFYDDILHKLYDDYMKLPPVDQRENRHKIVELKL